ncbi:hypothetical protein Tco_1021148 [Tanacetum coccineum]
MVTVDIIHSIVKMLKYDPRDIMFYHFKIPNKTLDWRLRALTIDDDVINISQYVKDNKVIDVYIEHGETIVESYHMPNFNKSVQIRDLDDNNEVTDLDEGNVDRRVVTKKQKTNWRTMVEFNDGARRVRKDGAKGLGHDNMFEDYDQEHGNEKSNDGA